MARARGLRPATISTRTDWIRRFARDAQVLPDAVTPRHVLAYVSAHDWAPETRRSVYASLRAFYRYMLDAGLMQVNPALVLPRVKPSAPAPRPAPERAVNAALMECDKRVGLILKLAAYAGLRRAEIAQIHARDIVEDILGFSLIVHGKGGKQRLVPINSQLVAELRELAKGGYVFRGDYGQGHLSPRYVGKLAARVLPDGYTLHTLRHRFATQAYAGTNDLLAVQQLLGHSSPAITQRYVQLPNARLRDVARAAGRVA